MTAKLPARAASARASCALALAWLLGGGACTAGKQSPSSSAETATGAVTPAGAAAAAAGRAGANAGAAGGAGASAAHTAGAPAANGGSGAGAPSVPGASAGHEVSPSDAGQAGREAPGAGPSDADHAGHDSSAPDAAAPDAAAGTRCSGPIGTFSGELASGIRFIDTDGQPVNAHGGGILREGDTFYLHGEFFSSTSTDNNFNGFSLYSSRDLATWHNEGIILPRQPDGELGPNRKGERPHIIRCPSSGEYVLYAHAASADYQTDREVVYATSATITGQYQYRGPLKNASGQIAAHSDMSAFADETGAYVLTEGGHVYTLASDCHSWLSDKSVPQVNGDSGGSESPTVFKAGGTYYWIGSYKTGWRANNNFYATAPALTGPWTQRGFLAPVADPSNHVSDERTWLSQSTWVTPVSGCTGTVYVYWGDHWDGNLDTTAPGKHNALATYVFQPLSFDGDKISLPVYHASWKLDVGAGTWSP